MATSDTLRRVGDLASTFKLCAKRTEHGTVDAEHADLKCSCFSCPAVCHALQVSPHAHWRQLRGLLRSNEEGCGLFSNTKLTRNTRWVLAQQLLGCGHVQLPTQRVHQAFKGWGHHQRNQAKRTRNLNDSVCLSMNSWSISALAMKDFDSIVGSCLNSRNCCGTWPDSIHVESLLFGLQEYQDGRNGPKSTISAPG